jgi:hypothetical protein
VKQSSAGKDVSKEAEDIVELRYQETTGEDIMSAVVRSRVCELVGKLELLVVTIHKCSVNPVINPNPRL